MKIVRLVGFSLGLVAALVSMLLLRPTEPARFQPIQVEGHQQLIEQAMDDYQANSTAAAENTDLQIVANGWVARDFLFVIANELDAVSEQLTVISAQNDALIVRSESDDRIPALLLVGLVMFAFHAATIPYVRSGAAEPLRFSDAYDEES